jgi:hypothetical protein
MEQGVVAVRERSRGDIGVMPVAEFKELARRLVETRALTNNPVASSAVSSETKTEEVQQ